MTFLFEENGRKKSLTEKNFYNITRIKMQNSLLGNTFFFIYSKELLKLLNIISPRLSRPIKMKRTSFHQWFNINFHFPEKQFMWRIVTAREAFFGISFSLFSPCSVKSSKSKARSKLRVCLVGAKMMEKAGILWLAFGKRKELMVF